jgi:hypothetical protein
MASCQAHFTSELVRIVELPDSSRATDVKKFHNMLEPAKQNVH